MYQTLLQVLRTAVKMGGGWNPYIPRVRSSLTLLLDKLQKHPHNELL